MPWYADWFDRPEYELVYQQRDEEEAERAADLIERVSQSEPGGRLLDVGCGRGRHARAFARHGYRVTGLDLSEKAIQAARRRAEEEDLAVDFRRQDMREPMGTDAFEGAVNLFSSFGYFDRDEEHQQVITRVAEALRQKGFFVQDFMNAHQVRASLVPESARVEDGLRIEEHRWIEAGRINKEITLRPTEGTSTPGVRPNGDGASQAPASFRESVRLLELDDFRRFYKHAGLRLEETFGDYDGTSYGESSPRLIMFSRKAP